MLKISFRNRIAFYYSVTTALFVFVAFFVIFLVVRKGVYSDLDNDLQKEIDDIFTEITITPAGFTVQQQEWSEKEHNTLDINPIFIQFTDSRGITTDRSPNLKRSYLHFEPLNSKLFYNTTLDSSEVRQAQAPVIFKGNTVGYILVAAPLKDADNVLEGLKNALFIAYPLIVIVLFSIARLLAGRSILPVSNIIETAGKISRENLSERIPYPANKDELYTLSQTINKLLDRIENAITREKQFTSDASHELRTPLAVIKGTLEVLIRKPRTQQEYDDKIKYCIAEIDRINILVDHLLLLARFESQKKAIKIENVAINAIILDSISRNAAPIREKGIKIATDIPDGLQATTDSYLLSIVLENLISNAVKYSNHGGLVGISGRTTQQGLQLEVSDNGIGIHSDELERIFSSFYRSRPDDHPHAKGNGLGLSIVKRLCEILGINIKIASEPGSGTVILLTLGQEQEE